MNTMDYVTLTIGSLGLIIAVISVGWQILAHRQSKIEEAKASLSWESNAQDSYLCVTVLNTGTPQLYIKRVELILRHRQQVSTNAKKTFQPEISVQFLPRDMENGPMQTGEERVYLALLRPTKNLYLANGADSIESLWISVNTPKGEVCRIQRSQVVPFLQRLVATAE